MCQLVSACTRLSASPVSTCFNSWPPVSACVSSCRLLVSYCSPVSTCFNLCQPASACAINSCLLVSACVPCVSDVAAGTIWRLKNNRMWQLVSSCVSLFSAGTDIMCQLASACFLQRQLVFCWNRQPEPTCVSLFQLVPTAADLLCHIVSACVNRVPQSGTTDNYFSIASSSHQ